MSMCTCEEHSCKKASLPRINFCASRKKVWSYLVKKGNLLITNSWNSCQQRHRQTFWNSQHYIPGIRMKQRSRIEVDKWEYNRKATKSVSPNCLIFVRFSNKVESYMSRRNLRRSTDVYAITEIRHEERRTGEIADRKFRDLLGIWAGSKNDAISVMRLFTGGKLRQIVAINDRKERSKEALFLFFFSSSPTAPPSLSLSNRPFTSIKLEPQNLGMAVCSSLPTSK